MGVPEWNAGVPYAASEVFHCALEAVTVTKIVLPLTRGKVLLLRRTIRNVGGWGHAGGSASVLTRTNAAATTTKSFIAG